MKKLTFEITKISDERYLKIRDRHYVPNSGCHGQQIHFLIYYDDKLVGIISGASSVYGVKARDEFFKIPKDKKLKEKFYLPAIINNTVFRIEKHDEANLCTYILAKWRRLISEIWEYLYEVPVIGFETFVVEEDWRKGTLYKADNWTELGETFGSTKSHKGLQNKAKRNETKKKIIYCKWNSKKPVVPTKEYVSSWRATSPEEKLRSKLINKKRLEILGKKYDFK